MSSKRLSDVVLDARYRWNQLDDSNSLKNLLPEDLAISQVVNHWLMEELSKVRIVDEEDLLSFIEKITQGEEV